jgi:hypothetical protein
VFEYLKALAVRIRQRGWPPLPPSEDPHAGVREPRRRDPGGRSTTVAVDEPDAEISVRAFGMPKR